MKLDDQFKKDLESLTFALVLLILFLLCFGKVARGQDMSYNKIEALKIELDQKPTSPKFNIKNQINNQVLVFISGAALTGFGIYQLTARRSYNFDSKSVKGAVPLNPHNMLLGAGLFTICISFVIQ